METAANNILDILEQNEQRVSELYALYAAKLPGHRKFWQGLSDEERGHAASIRQMHSRFPAADFRESNFTRGALRYVIDFLREKTEEARNSKLTHRQALESALRIEQSILEKKCLEFFLPTDEKLAAVIARINQETSGHVARLQEEAAKRS